MKRKKYTRRPMISKRQAVYTALDVLGPVAKRADLVKEAQQYTRKKVMREDVTASKRPWAVLRGREDEVIDSRTYKAQPDRNMTNASAGRKLSVEDIPKAEALLRKLKMNALNVLQLIEDMGHATKVHEALLFIATRNGELRIPKAA